MTALSVPAKSLALYIHSPFCVHKCGYCDFNSWGETSREPMEQWFDALARQIQFWSQRLKQGVVVDTVFWGGGTPSLLPNDLIEKVGQLLAENFKISELAEFTIECNPETLDEQKLKALHSAGANRLSVGIQSFTDSYLEALERRARRPQNLAALEILSTHWDGRWSADLMFGLPEQTLESWLGEMDQLLAFKPQHVSAYELTLSTQRSKNWKKPAESELLFFYNLTQERMAEAGLERYEVSNFAVPGQESQHNLKYWRVQNFLGVGPGASGLLLDGLSGSPLDQGFGVHQKQKNRFESWCQGAGQASYETACFEGRSAWDHLFETLMMGLRLSEGVDRQHIRTLASSLEAGPEKAEEILEGFRAWGWLAQDFERWRCTPRGFLLLDTLLTQFAQACKK